MQLHIIITHTSSSTTNTMNVINAYIANFNIKYNVFTSNINPPTKDTYARNCKNSDNT